MFNNGATATVPTSKIFGAIANKTELDVSVEGQMVVSIIMKLRSHDPGTGGNGKAKFKLILGGIFLVISALAASELAMDGGDMMNLRFVASTLGILVAVNLIMESLQQTSKEGRFPHISLSLPPPSLSLRSYK
jgi:hypothetical protein